MKFSYGILLWFAWGGVPLQRPEHPRERPVKARRGPPEPTHPCCTPLKSGQRDVAGVGPALTRAQEEEEEEEEQHSCSPWACTIPVWNNNQQYQLGSKLPKYQALAKLCSQWRHHEHSHWFHCGKTWASAFYRRSLKYFLSCSQTE